MQAAWTSRFGASRPTTSLILAAMSSSRSAKTYSTYNSSWRKFVEFATLNNIHPLTATPYDICHYAAWLAQQGTVNLSTAQNYFSSINAVYADLGLEGPARGQLFALVRSGLARMQRDTAPRQRELAIPATVVEGWLNAAQQMTDVTESNAGKFRSLLACVVCFMTMSRPHSIALLPVDGVLLDSSTATGMVIYRRYTKTTQTDSSTAPGRIGLSFPSPPFRLLVTALERLDRWRRQVLPSAEYFFQLPGDRQITPNESASAAFASWFDTAMSVATERPPANAVWVPRSLRSGAASAAEAAGVPRSKIEHVGGWAIGSTSLAKHYIDPSYRHTPAGNFFFGYLRGTLSDPPAVP